MPTTCCYWVLFDSQSNNIAIWCIVDTGSIIISEENDSENAGIDFQYSKISDIANRLTVTVWYLLLLIIRRHSVQQRLSAIKPFLLLGLAAEYRSRRSDGGCDQQLSDDHKKFMTLTGKLTAPETISRSIDVKNRRLNLPYLYLAPPLEFCRDFWHYFDRLL